MSQAGRRLVRRLAAEHVQRQATSSTAGAAVEAAVRIPLLRSVCFEAQSSERPSPQAGRRGVASASGRQTSDEAAASRGGRVFLNALLGGATSKLVEGCHPCASSTAAEFD